MDNAFFDFVHVRHFDAFVAAAREHRCHILVRKTGRASLQYCGQAGYTGKRADMKAKTAVANLGHWQLAGLVCSPLIHPGVCKPDALTWWQQSAHLVTAPPDGFDDRDQPRGCRTPYLLQLDKRHRHYGCVALVEYGLLTPRYVHGDYDLYAIFPAGVPFEPAGQAVRRTTLASSMSAPAGMTLEQRVRFDAARQAHAVSDLTGPLSFRVATFLNVQIARSEPGLLGALMVNHGEHLNQGAGAQDFQEVLAFMPEPRGGVFAQVLRGQAAHEAYFRQA